LGAPYAVTESIVAAEKATTPQQKAESRQTAPDRATERLETPEHTLSAAGAVQLARRAPEHLTPGAVLVLQRSVGNHAISRLLKRVVQRVPTTKDGWDTRYTSKKSRTLKSYEDYQAGIGSNSPEIKAASEWEAAGDKKGRKVKPVTLTSTELADILKPETPAKQITDAQKEEHRQRLAGALDQINQAFETMMIDTVEAQASFLAHMAGETGTLSFLEERGGKNLSYAPFYGRGTAHTTFEYNYVQTLAYLEKMAQQLDGQAKLKQAEKDKLGDEVDATTKISALFEIQRIQERAKLVREAWQAVKGNIDEAANPRYAFLFSAAYMHMSGGVKRSAELSGQSSATFAGPGAEDQWVTGQGQSWESARKQAVAKGEDTKAIDSAISRAKIKKATFERAVAVLSKKVVPEAAVPATQ
jgi:hypothetical protein